MRKMNTKTMTLQEGTTESSLKEAGIWSKTHTTGYGSEPGLKRQVMAQVHRFLLLTRKIWIEFLAPDLSLGQLQ